VASSGNVSSVADIVTVKSLSERVGRRHGFRVVVYVSAAIVRLIMLDLAAEQHQVARQSAIQTGTGAGSNNSSSAVN
jgi:hypothetical protein